MSRKVACRVKKWKQNKYNTQCSKSVIVLEKHIILSRTKIIKKFVALFDTLMVHNTARITSVSHGNRFVLKRAKSSKDACLKIILYFFKIKTLNGPFPTSSPF